MTSAGPGIVARLLGALAIALLVCLAPVTRPVSATRVEGDTQPGQSRSTVPAETRALWVLRTSLTTPASIAALVANAREHGFNTLLVQVRGRGDAYYRGGIEPLPPDLLRQPASFDPLASVLEQAHGAGLRVHAWVNVNLVSSAADLPVARAHLIYRHPGWLMVPRDIAQELATIAPESPAYVGKIARWTRAQSAGVEGLYASPIVPEAAAYIESITRGLARRYALDGIHFDYARYPNERFDYSRTAIREFRTHVRPGLDAATRRTLDSREPADLFAYPDGLPDGWLAFRIARMTALMTRLRDAVKAERPDAMVTVAAAPDATEAYERRMQDWRGWLAHGIIDGIAPMAYTTEPAVFAEQIAAARKAAGDRVVWAGIGAWRLSPQATVQNIHAARRLGAAGIVLFSYDSLINPRQSTPGYLATVSRGAFAGAGPNGSK